MAQTIRLKRSAVQGKIPLITDLQLGEIALNTYDGKLFIKRNVSGTESIVEVGSKVKISNTAPLASNSQSGDLWFNNDDGNFYIYYNDGDSSQWVQLNSDIVDTEKSNTVTLTRLTTTSTSTVLTLDGNTPSGNNEIVLPDKSIYYLKGNIIAGQTNGGDVACWEFSGAVKRGIGAATTTIVESFKLDRMIYSGNSSSWNVLLSANTTTGGFRVSVTGATSTSIRWSSEIKISQMLNYFI